MRLRVSLLLILLAIGFSEQSQSRGSLSEKKFPKIFLKLSPTFDAMLCAQSGTMIPKSWWLEANEKFLHFEKLWHKHGPALLAETVNEIGKPFPRRERTVTLVLCPKLPALGTPLLIPYWPFLQLWEAHEPLDQSIFYTYLFHEILHHYVYEYIPFDSPTPLKTKYKNERPLVIAHLHLMAIQEHILRKLGKIEELKKLKKTDAQYKPEYKRSWEIVGKEGHKAFILEMRSKK